MTNKIEIDFFSFLATLGFLDVIVRRSMNGTFVSYCRDRILIDVCTLIQSTLNTVENENERERLVSRVCERCVCLRVDHFHGHRQAFLADCNTISV